MQLQGYFLLRRPVFPREALEQFHRSVTEQVGLTESVFRFFLEGEPEAMLLSTSPVLYRELERLHTQPEKRKERKKLAMALYRYLLRMCTRATPFGMLAGVSFGTFGENTQVRFNQKRATKSRPDGRILSAVFNRFFKDKRTWEVNEVKPNPGLYTCSGEYRFVERAADGSAFITSVEAPEPVAGVLEYYQNGVWAGHRELINQMVEQQLLVPVREQNVTGKQYLKVLTADLQDLENPFPDAAFLRVLHHELEGEKLEIANLKRLETLVSQNLGLTTTHPVVHVDTVFETTGCIIADEPINTLLKDFRKLKPLLAGRNDTTLQNFARKFTARYDRAEVPLLLALDEESGIGYAYVQATQTEVKTGSPDHSIAEQLYETALLSGDLVVQIPEKILPGIENERQPGTEGMFLLGSVHAASQERFDRGDFNFLLKSGGGSSGFELLGRFGHTDPRLLEQMTGAARRHQSLNPEIIFAEIAHLPSALAANVLTRPHLRDYEIVFLAGSTLPPEKQIPVSDLLVSVDLNGQVVIKSKRLNKRIIPRLSTAHNYLNGLPVYRFLCDLAAPAYHYQWSWGRLDNRLFLPRVQYKNWILSRARWKIDPEKSGMEYNNHAVFPGQWAEYRRQARIPRFCFIADGDNELFLDNDYFLSVEILRDHLLKGKVVVLLEQPDEATGFLGGYDNEIVLPLHTTRPVGYPVSLPCPASSFQRDFPIGSEWIYLKVYCGVFTAQQLLMDLLDRFTREIVAEGLAEKWFFIRYHDTDHHLRLRFYSRTKGACLQILERFISQVSASRYPVHNTLVAGYSRELERYTGLDYELTESIFFADSVCVLQLLVIAGQTGEDLLTLAVFGTEQLLRDLGFDQSQRMEIYTRTSSTLFKQDSEAQQTRIKLDTYYREKRNELKRALRLQHSPTHSHSVAKLFERRSIQIKKAIQPQTSPLPESVGASFVHMFINRLFSSDQLYNELVTVYFLKKHHLSASSQN